MIFAIALLSGLVFGLGLLLSGMTDPAKVLGFLDLFGAWDPSLALVMGGAIGLALPGFRLADRARQAWCGQPLPAPPKGRVNPRLVVGSVLFGVGWGLVGYCPGPAVVALGLLRETAFLFVPAMMVGCMLAARLSPFRPEE
jgi:uncharacterized membrane protein YedE/YeeE